MSIIAILLTFTMLAVMWFDITRYIIPNWLVGLMLLSYPLALLFGLINTDWPMAMLGMLLMFAVGYGVFILKWMGGGDIKLLSACALWVGWKNLPDFIFTVAIMGGIFAVVIWGLRKALPYARLSLTSEKLPRILRDAEPIPYGVAIAFGFLALLGTGKVGF